MDFSSFDKLSIGIVAINCKNNVMYINNAYLRYLGKDYSDVINKPITSIMSSTKLPEIVQTGKTVHGVWQKMPNGYLYGNRLPLVEDGKIIGALGELVLTNTEAIEELSRKLLLAKSELTYLNRKLTNVDFSNNLPLIYKSFKMQKIYLLAQKVAPLNSTVLITGESGCGKEVIAELIHTLGNRADKPLVKLNCAAIPTELFESELFGYERGAFTGASPKGKIGKFEQADKGILFLDEISSMPFALQSKLLRVLQDKEIEHLGSNSKKQIDVKIIAATNENLVELVNQKKFRQDLYYRLNVINIDVPPLRERVEDIAPLALYFLNKYTTNFNKPKMQFTYSAIVALENYSWPGNVRELKNVMERIAILGDSKNISSSEIEQFTTITQNHVHLNFKSLTEQVNEYEKSIIFETLKQCKGNKIKAAEKLNINRSTLYSKIEKYKLD